MNLKKILSVGLLIMSLGAHAIPPVPPSAILLLEDAQVYLQFGTMSAYLAKELNSIRSENKSLSEEEALDLLTSKAISELN